MSQDTLPPYGTEFQGGYYAGCIAIAGDLHAIIVAPKAQGETQLAWGHEGLDLPGACSYFDGMANTVALAEAGHTIGQWARGLNVNGHTDWYLPARDELELLYRNLKPGTEENYTWRSGDNPSSIPAGYPYTAALPAQTPVAAFQEGAAEAFETEWHWSSTQYSRGNAWYQTFVGGNQSITGKSYAARARGVRRFKV